MNSTEQSVKPKNTRVAYHYERYPMDLYDETGKARRVNNQAEEEKALAEGFTENPPAIPQTVAVHAMTTQPAIQSGYDALKKELEGKTVEFNVKYSALQLKYQNLEKAHKELQDDYAKLTVDHEVLLKDAAPKIEKVAADPVAVADTIAANPFAQMPAEPPVKSRAALMADELKAKAKSKAAVVRGPDNPNADK